MVHLRQQRCSSAALALQFHFTRERDALQSRHSQNPPLPLPALRNDTSQPIDLGNGTIIPNANATGELKSVTGNYASSANPPLVEHHPLRNLDTQCRTFTPSSRVQSRRRNQRIIPLLRNSHRMSSLVESTTMARSTQWTDSGCR